MPPLLTVVFFVWLWHTVESYILGPIEDGGSFIIMRFEQDSFDDVPDEANPAQITIETRGGEKMSFAEFAPDVGASFSTVAARQNAGIIRFVFNERTYVPIDPENWERSKWIPDEVYTAVLDNPGERQPNTVEGYYRRYISLTYLRREFVIPIFLVAFVMTLYLVGKFMAAGAGRIFLNFAERMLYRLPLIRTVYSAVKQVTDFAFQESEIEFTRIVALQYPRKGIWSMGFVTGESFADIHSKVQEPIVSVLMPTSPMPATGFTVTVPKSETIDLDITIDQAIQFCVSCGVVIPPHQQYNNEVGAELSAQIAAHEATQGETPALAGPADEDED